ncbi:prolactin-8A9-like [Meriones unguiculatus]|uniref:prolactin-8A9-like n=1 Tax=Meriones unguiculatus TaxID=10047 RepID=UPI00293F3CE9|nr:prolactin-8A9-like [Meriones unguiculatus]
MELPLSQLNFSGTLLLLLVMSNLLLWEKAAAIPACHTEDGSCSEPLVETFNNAIHRAENIHNLIHQLHEEFFYQEFSSSEFSTITKKYVKMMINFVGAWITPLYHLVAELSAMEGVPETILSKANEIEENNRDILDDLRWILTKAYPTARMKEDFPTWQYLPVLKSNNKYYKFLAIFNLSSCLKTCISYTIYHIRDLKCLITGEGC